MASEFYHIGPSVKHFRVILPPYTPLLYSKTGVCRGIPICLNFAPKHRLWVLVITVTARRPQSMFAAKIRKISKIEFSAENFQILKLKKSLYIAWASFRNDEDII